jgi:ATP-dependent Clp protease ATP-binding subunit ClpC
VFERFTEQARQVVVLAPDEARGLVHSYIGTEHLLLGLLRQEQGVGARVLDSLDVTFVEVRTRVARIVGRGDAVASGQIPFTPRAKKVLELALREALALGHRDIGTEHLLLGLVRENQGVVARILVDFQLTACDVAASVSERLAAAGGAPEYVSGFRPSLRATSARTCRRSAPAARQARRRRCWRSPSSSAGPCR